MPILETRALSHVYSEGTPFEKTAVHDISLAIEEGELLGVIGHTGSGKSTFIQHLNGLLKPSAGQVLFQGRDIHADKDALRAVRFGVGLVFQYPEYQLFEETVFRDIAFGPKNMGLGEAEIRERVYEAASFVGVGPELMETSPLELSGGQKRRVAIAGVIAMRPEVLILDEPTAGLDPGGREELMENILRYHDGGKRTVIYITHSMEDAARTAQRIVVFNHGRIAMDGTPREVFRRGFDLIQMGIIVPQITRVMMRLRELGLDVDDGVYSVDQAMAALWETKGGGDHA